MEGTLKPLQFHPLAVGWLTPHYIRLLRASSKLAIINSRDGAKLLFLTRSFWQEAKMHFASIGLR